jgi:Uma2 family endonuclease
MISTLNQLDLEQKYSYADYIAWQIQERVELIRGRIMQMAAPNVRHQRISMRLSTKIGGHLYKTSCQLFAAPFDVRLPLPVHRIKNDKIDTVVQPDLCIICDNEKLDQQGCIGAPNLIIEILSPGNSKKEMRDKYELYEEAGVQEYWVIFPDEQLLQRYILDNKSTYQAQRPNVQGDLVPISFLDGFMLDLDELFEG